MTRPHIVRIQESFPHRLSRITKQQERYLRYRCQGMSLENIAVHERRSPSSIKAQCFKALAKLDLPAGNSAAMISTFCYQLGMMDREEVDQDEISANRPRVYRP